LNKLAHNISFGHGIHAGIHWRSDTDSSILLGEAFASQLPAWTQVRVYNEKLTVHLAKIDAIHARPSPISKQSAGYYGSRTLRDLQPISHLSKSRQIRRRPPDQYLPLAVLYIPDVLRAGQGDVEPTSSPQGHGSQWMPSPGVSWTALQRWRLRNHRPLKMLPDRPAGNLLTNSYGSSLVAYHSGQRAR